MPTDAPSATALVHHALSDAGLVHHVQEDSWAVLDTADGGRLYVVCDGMGGMGHGDEASQLAVRTLTARLAGGLTRPAEEMTAALTEVDVEVRRALCAHGRGLPGTTAVLAWVRGAVAHVAWVGDSRAYWIRDGQMVVRTRDHKLVEELVAIGQLTAEEARTSPFAHVVTRAIGGRPPDEPPVEASIFEPWPLGPGDVVLLCSDGLSDLATDDEIAAATVGRSPEETARVLLQLALDRGGHDNITIVAACVPGQRPETPVPDFGRGSNRDLVPWLLGGGLLGGVVVVGVSLLRSLAS